MCKGHLGENFDYLREDFFIEGKISIFPYSKEKYGNLREDLREV